MRCAMSELRLLADHLLTLSDQPLVLRHLIEQWPALKWDPQFLARELPQQTMKFRIGQKHHKGIQWETDCLYKEARIADFVDWLRGDCKSDNPLVEYNREAHSCYADYKYMHQLFAGKPHMLQAVQWESLGFPGRDGADSTWWLGSEGAYTVCHYDTYGCNLVAQIYGRKRWTLFAPANSAALYPTRIPYEESSIFSQVNIRSPDFTRHPKYKEAAPYRVTLEPGEVLFVPRHWWHFVECLEPSISINTWLDLDCDDDARLAESVTRLLACSLMASDGESDVTGSLQDWLNPTEEATSFGQNMTYIRQAVNQVGEQGNTGGSTEALEHHKVNSDANSSGTDCSSIQKSEDFACEPHVKVQKLEENSESSFKVQEICTLDKSRSKNDASMHLDSFGCQTTVVNAEFEKRHVMRLAAGCVTQLVDSSMIVPPDSGMGSTVMRESCVTDPGVSDNRMSCVSDNRISCVSDNRMSCMSDDREQSVTVTGNDSMMDTAHRKTSPGHTTQITEKDIVNCILNPNVVDVICKNIRELSQIKH